MHRLGFFQRSFATTRSLLNETMPINHQSTVSIGKRSIPAIFARGGTSTGLVLWKKDLPPESQWGTILPALMGSPDPYGRQLDGMGSGISSTSKICILSPSLDKSVAGVDFTFVQVGVKDNSLDTAGNCGNMLSIVGPVAFDGGLSECCQIETDLETGERTALIRIFNTNTRKVVHSRFRVSGEPPSYSPMGTYEMDGVPGKQSQINLAFINPGGAATGKILPTGNRIDTLRLPDGGTIEASLIDVSNPGVFVRVSDLGVRNPASLDPAAVEADAALKVRLEQIRQAGASVMGLSPNTQSVPKIVLVFPPEVTQQSRGVHIKCLALSMGQAHKSVPLTLGLCLGAAARLPGTIPNQLAVGADGSDTIVVGHPGGKLDVAATVKDGEVLSVDLSRTARVLMTGSVFY